jgi:hypothetical protein
MRKPDELIGSEDDPYMQRWILFRPGWFQRFVGRTTDRIQWYLTRRALRQPRPKDWLPSIYLHKFLRSDDDRHFHDHVGWSISIMLSAGYWEVTPDASRAMIQELPHLVPSYRKRWTWVKPWTIRFRRATDPHFIALGRVVTRDKFGFETISSNRTALHDIPVWSLWIRGPWRREWGFYTQDGWMPWHEYHDRGEEIYESKAP